MSFSQFSKLTTICNICFLLTFINHHYSILNNSGFSSTIIILGQIFSLGLTIIFLILFFFKKETSKEIKILVALNSILFLLQIYYYFLF